MITKDELSIAVQSIMGQANETVEGHTDEDGMELRGVDMGAWCKRHEIVPSDLLEVLTAAAMASAPVPPDGWEDCPDSILNVLVNICTAGFIIAAEVLDARVPDSELPDPDNVLSENPDEGEAA